MRFHEIMSLLSHEERHYPFRQRESTKAAKLQSVSRAKCVHDIRHVGVDHRAVLLTQHNAYISSHSFSGIASTLYRRPSSIYAMTTAVSDPLAGPSALRDIIRPQFHQNNFIEESFIKNELGVKLDKGQYWCAYISLKD